MRVLVKWFFLVVAVMAVAAPERIFAVAACTCARFNDFKDCGCHKAPGGLGAPASGAKNAGSNKASCPTCPPPNGGLAGPDAADPSISALGMPRWWVDEPYLNLHVVDEPLSYTTSSGQKLAFQWLYRQRYTLPAPDQVPSLYNIAGVLGPRFYGDVYLSEACLFDTNYQYYFGHVMTNAVWMHNFMSHILFWDANWESTFTPYNPSFSNGHYEALAFNADGGVDYYTSNGLPNPTTFTQLVPLYTNGIFGTYPVVSTPTPDGNGIYWGTATNGFKIVYPDGSQDIYGLAYWLGQDAYDTSAEALLTQRIDAQGRVTKVGYQNVASFTNICNGYHIMNENPLLCLRVQYVVDSDGHTNTFSYQSNCADIFQVTQVSDSFGRSATFAYGGCGSSPGWLTNITDAAHNTSTFTYASTVDGQPNTNAGWLSSLVTPYGTTSFYYQDLMDPTETSNYTARATYVTEPDSASQLFCFILNTSNAVESSAAPPVVSGWAFDTGTNGGGDEALYHRNTFYWDRRQTMALSTNVTQYLPGNLSNAISALTTSTADLKKGRMQHWLLDTDDISITETLSSERDPSPDSGGTIEGSRTWYAYTNAAPTDVLTTTQIGCVAQVLPNGTSQYTTYQYYSSGLAQQNVQSYSLPGGGIGQLTTSYSYYPNDIDLSLITNSLGQKVAIEYNSFHEPVAITNALNQVTTLGYDSGTHNLTSVALYNGQTVALSYYGSPTAFLEQTTLQPENKVTTIASYSGPNPQVIHVTGTGLPDLWQTNSWDNLNRLTGVNYQDGTAFSNIYTYLDLTATKDRVGDWTYYAYDGLQHLISTIDSRNNETQFTWCDCGALTSISNALGNFTYLNYNNQELLTNIEYPDGSSMNWQYDLLQRVTNSFDGSGSFQKFSYNNQSFVTAVSNAYGQVWGVYDDALGRPVTVTNINNVVATNSYDLLNRLTNRVWTGGGTENFGYSSNGLVAYTNQDGQWTHLGRDGAGRMTALTNAVQTEFFGWNGLDELSSLTDGNSHTTSWGFNQYGWLTSKTNALGLQNITYSYDADGRVTNRWMMGTNTGYTYDAVGNLTSIIYPQLTIANAYDAINELTNMSDAVGTTRFAYTATGQPAGETDIWTNGDSGSNSVTFAYNQGHRTNLNLTQPSGSWTQNYTYDSAWRMTGIMSPAGSFVYTPGGASIASPLIKALSLPDSAYITNTYDTVSRLTGTVLNNQWGHTLDGYLYELSPMGLRYNITRELGLATNTIGSSYDQIDELSIWTGFDPGETIRLNESTSFFYDTAGNLTENLNEASSPVFFVDAQNQLTNVHTSFGYYILQVTGAVTAGVTNVKINGAPVFEIYSDFTFFGNAQNQSNSPNATISIVAQNQSGISVTNVIPGSYAGSVTLSYDSNGNLTYDGAKTMAYDAENQLTNAYATNSFGFNLWRVGFVYDGLNRRRIERDYTGSGFNWTETSETRFIYDGRLPIQERDTNNNPQVSYTRGLDLSLSLQGAGGIGGLLARTDANGSSYYHSDANGNITALIDGNQDMVARYEYDGFGRTIGAWGSLANANRYRFSSKEYVSSAGLYYYGFRFYSPKLQRWISRDPIGEAGGINLYEFVGDDPVNEVDPFGLTTYISETPLGPGPIGSYGPFTYTVDDGSDAVLPAVPSLTDSQGLNDVTPELGIFLPMADVGGALLDAGEDALGGLGKTVGKRLAKCPEKPKGQIHHAISRPIHKALERHPNLKGNYEPRDPRFTAQALDQASHQGYQAWHRDLDVEISDWINSNPNATTEDFENYLFGRYSQPDVLARFPDGL